MSRAKRHGPSRFYAYWLRRAYECGYKDAIEDARRAVVGARRPARPDTRKALGDR